MSLDKWINFLKQIIRRPLVDVFSLTNSFLTRAPCPVISFNSQELFSAQEGRARVNRYPIIICTISLNLLSIFPECTSLNRPFIRSYVPHSCSSWRDYFDHYSWLHMARCCALHSSNIDSVSAPDIITKQKKLKRTMEKNKMPTAEGENISNVNIHLHCVQTLHLTAFFKRPKRPSNTAH